MHGNLGLVTSYCGFSVRSWLTPPSSADNVVRAGLTPKLRDVPTLTSMLTYTSSPPSEQVLPPVGFRSTKYTTLYDPPIEEFAVLLTNLASGQAEHFEAIDGPSILIFTELESKAVVKSEGVEVEVGRAGQVFFVGAGVEVDVEAKGGKVTAYRAFVEAP